MTEMNPNNRNETKSDIFSWYVFFFIGHKMLKYFNDFHNWYLSISLQK